MDSPLISVVGKHTDSISEALYEIVMLMGLWA